MEQYLDSLFGKKSKHIKPGIASIKDAQACLDSPREVSSAIIGGTNGKGTTSGMLWHLMAVCGVRVGLYSSPHLVHFHERFQLSHKNLNDQVLVEDAKAIEAALSVDLYDQLSFFDISTLIAQRLFAKHDVEWAIYEVGLGGRLDSTNGLEHEVMAVTSIGLDHEEWLGQGVKNIAKEKLGIGRKEKPLLWGMRPDEDIEAYQIYLEKQKELEFSGAVKGERFGCDHSKEEVWFLGKDHGKRTFPMPQWVRKAPLIIKENFSISLALLHEIVYLKSFAPVLERLNLTADELIETSLDRFATVGSPWPVSLQGRFQKILVQQKHKQAQGIWVDVCHNMPSIARFVENINMFSRGCADVPKVPGIVSVLKDKDIGNMLEALSQVLDPLIVYQVPGDRSITVDRMKEAGVNFPLFESFHAAWNYAQEHWCDLNQDWAVCGSFYGVGEVFRYFKIQPHTQYTNDTLTGVIGP